MWGKHPLDTGKALALTRYLLLEPINLGVDPIDLGVNPIDLGVDGLEAILKLGADPINLGTYTLDVLLKLGTDISEHIPQEDHAGDECPYAGDECPEDDGDLYIDIQIHDVLLDRAGADVGSLHETILPQTQLTSCPEQTHLVSF